MRRYDLPPLDQLEAFEASARHLSFTKAADELALTQSAVSRKIAALEAHYGQLRTTQSLVRPGSRHAHHFALAGFADFQRLYASAVG